MIKRETDASVPQRSRQSTGRIPVPVKKRLPPQNTASILHEYQMCGIVGYWDKAGSEESALGSTVFKMIEALGCRGPDSAGVALFGAAVPDRVLVRVKLGDAASATAVQSQAGSLGAAGFTQTGPYLRFSISGTNDLQSLIAAVESAGAGVEVVSAGKRLEIIKEVGSPANLERAFNISGFRGTHGIGHTRLSTESIVDLSHSQPFWGRGYPGLAVVHNGHITNYHQLRRRYEQKGVRFYTENDSEVIGIYLARKLTEGSDLRRAFEAMTVDLDGSFSCLAATDTEFGFVKDPFSLKPLIFAETDSFAAIATEEIALRAALDGDYQVREARAREVRVWQR